MNRIPLKKEVKKIVFNLNKDSACGVDGVLGTFFQVCSNIIEDDIWNMVKAFLV